jgi:flagella basal body P-ring formation protein FlgA
VADAGAVNWSGAAAVAVRTKTQSVSAQTLSDAAMSAVRAQFAANGRNVTVALSAPPADVELPVGQIAVRQRGRVKVQAGRAPVWLDLLVENQVYRTVVVQVSVSARQQAYVALHAMATGALVGAQDFALTDTEVAGLDVVPADQLLMPFRVAHAIRAGETLTPAAMLASGKIMRGDEVRVLIQAGQIGIETAATAMNDAHPGEVIRVRRAGGSDIVSGRVSQSGAVIIE